MVIEQIPGSIPPEMAGVFQPVIDTISPIITIVSAFLGGLFGLYLIYTIVKICLEARRNKVLKDIRYNFDQLNEHFGLRTSQDRKKKQEETGKKKK